MAHDFERKDVYTLDFVLSKIPDGNKKGKILDIDGVRVSFGKRKLRLFKRTRPLKCAHCGLEAMYFALERHKTNEKGKGWHFNLYGMVGRKEVMLTIDHIIPKARGGTNEISNMQVLCEPCNVAKGDKLEGHKEQTE